MGSEGWRKDRRGVSLPHIVGSLVWSRQRRPVGYGESLRTNECHRRSSTLLEAEERIACHRRRWARCGSHREQPTSNASWFPGAWTHRSTSFPCGRLPQRSRGRAPRSWLPVLVCGRSVWRPRLSSLDPLGWSGAPTRSQHDHKGEAWTHGCDCAMRVRSLSFELGRLRHALLFLCGVRASDGMGASSLM